jgi:hypothetical protein
MCTALFRCPNADIHSHPFRRTSRAFALYYMRLSPRREGAFCTSLLARNSRPIEHSLARRELALESKSGVGGKQKTPLN